MTSCFDYNEYNRGVNQGGNNNAGFNYVPRGRYGGNMPYRPAPLVNDTGERSLKGGIWFVVLLPAIALYIQSIAVSKWAGYFLWATVIVAEIIACVMDRRALAEAMQGFDTSSLKKWVWLPPMYVYKREKFIGKEGLKALMLMIFTIAAIFGNGFVLGKQVNEDSITEIIESATVSSFTNLYTTSDNVVYDRLTSYLGKYTSEVEKAGDEYTLTFTGEHDGKPAAVTVKVIHDGFVYVDCLAEGVTLDGKALEGDDLTAALKEIFIPEEADSSSSAEGEE